MKPKTEPDDTLRRSSLVGKILKSLMVGESVTFSRTIDNLPDSKAGGKIAMLVGSYTARHRPEGQWDYESFTAITSRGRPIAGVVLTLKSEPVWVAPHVKSTVSGTDATGD